MEEKQIPPFDAFGILEMESLLASVPSELYPVYLSTLVDFLGKNLCQLPTQENETALLMALKSELTFFKKPQPDVFIRAQKMLTRTRKKRMYETSLFLIQNRQKKPETDR